MRMKKGKRRNSDYIVTDACCGENGYRLQSMNELRAGDDFKLEKKKRDTS